jgi:hypothetical protein
MNLILQILLSVFLLSNNNVIDNYLKDHLKDFKRYEYEIPKNYTEKIFPDENREFKLEKNYAYMPVNFILNNGEKKQGIVTLKVKLYDDVLVSIRDIKKNEELSISDFQIEEKEITGKGSAKSSGMVRTKLSAMIDSVLANGLLRIKGSRKIVINDEEQMITIRGVVRTSDIQTDNTVYSYNISDAEIIFQSEGQIKNMQDPGWITKLFHWLF